MRNPACTAQGLCESTYANTTPGHDWRNRDNSKRIPETRLVAEGLLGKVCHQENRFAGLYHRKDMD